MHALIILGLVSSVLAAPVQIAHIDDPAFDLNVQSDVDGSYHFTYATEDSSKTETRIPTGRITGAFSYIDTDGILQKVQYVADENGFQAYGTNLPVGSTVPVKETPEVLEATAQHFALVDEHLKKIAKAAELEKKYKVEHPVEKSKGPARNEFHFHTPANKVQAVKQILHIPVAERVRPKVEKVLKAKKVAEVVDNAIPVAPGEPEDIQAARAAHLAVHARLTAQHLAAVQALAE